jgi:putative DNA primase/helicase
VASSALAALSLAVQAHADVRRAEKLQGPTGLFLLTVADSGERKSTCDGFFMQAIRDYEAAQAETAKPLVTLLRSLGRQASNIPGSARICSGSSPH